MRYIARGEEQIDVKSTTAATASPVWDKME